MSMSKITLEVGIKPFRVPANLALVGSIKSPLTGLETRTVDLSSVPLRTLRDLCEEFVVGVLKNAGYEDSGSTEVILGVVTAKPLPKGD